jgi:hypothetical protein
MAAVANAQLVVDSRFEPTIHIFFYLEKLEYGSYENFSAKQ